MSSSKRSTIIVEHLRKQQMWDAISKGKRLDGRNLDETRPIEIEQDIQHILSILNSDVQTTYL